MTLLFHIAEKVVNRPVMMMPEKLSLIASVLDRRIGIDSSGLGGFEVEYLKKAAPDASRFVGNYEPNDPKNPAAGRKPYRTTPEGVAVIGVVGSLVNRGGWIGAYSGITSYEGLKHQLATAARDASVSSILLDMDSPGGEAVGAFEAADAVRAAAAVKEVVAVVNGMAASAAYAIASAATRIVTTSSGISGSIGVVMLHADYSRRLENEGIKPTLIYAGARKVDGNPYEKLSSEVKGELKAEIDRFYDLFVSSVAKGRKGMTERAIRATEARTYIGADAVKVGLADAVGSFESVLAHMTDAAPPRPVSFPGRGLTFTQTDVDRARAEGRFEGLEASITDNGIEAVQNRMRSILDLPEARGRERLAQSLALTGRVSVEEARKALITIPTETDVRRAGGTSLGLVINNAGK